VSLGASESHRLRKAQLGAASGQFAVGQISLGRVNCGAKARIGASAYKLLLTHELERT
jgi:hypothetical protein